MFNNPYVAKILEFSDIAFAGDRVPLNKNHWNGYFLKNMGKAPQKIVLEVGCSNGQFLNDIAKESQDFAFIGIDWKYKLVYKAAEKSKKVSNTNVAFLRTVAEKMDDFLAEKEINEAWLFFPDPWAKASQQKHRVFQEPFLKNLQKVLSDDGRIYVKTDHPGYFAWMLSYFGIDISAEIQDDSHLKLQDESEESKSRKGRQVLHRTYNNKDLPETSKFAVENFEVLQWSVNFWRDRDSLLKPFAEKDVPAFFNKSTLFEKLFQKDNLPVYYLALRKR